MKTTFKRTLGRALIFSAPFLLISAAIVLIVIWAANTYLEGNLYYRVATLAPEAAAPIPADESSPALTDPFVELEEDEREKIKQENEEVFHDEDVPPIRLGEVWAHISIESAEVDNQPVYHGDLAKYLVKGIGHYSNSRFPGQHGKTVMAGHVGINSHFQRLETMQAGDTVTLNTIYGDYVYRVTETRIYDEDDPALRELIMPDEEDTGNRLICYTCYPYHTTRVRTKRFVIDCELIYGYDFVTHEMIDLLPETDTAPEGDSAGGETP